MKKRYSILVTLTLSMVLFMGISEITYAQPKISNCDISPKEIKYQTEVTISFDYEYVEGGLKESRVILNQKIQLLGDEKVVTRTSNWQVYLLNLSEYTSESGRFEKKFINTELWRGPQIELTYEIKVIDKNGNESNICTTLLRPLFNCLSKNYIT